MSCIDANKKEAAMLRIFTLMILFAAMSLLAGCNTIEGAGEDIESVGEEIEDDAS